ncbi:hypothetical protein [Falsiroseomonas tokyonensis]|uniref:ArsR family transcriptional regulator n=1 Tax=Falsiroseomonas tokyonensis TaxID=430521 RepID=A0ABV7BZ10_9PROT|nr:hypothetical protein [Falsiroseomonas tokyonensis]MBU8540230.1 hypothetical protein [Falsiroseomonas tokyonensis]
MARRPSAGFERARLAPLLRGEDLAEMLALAEVGVCCGGSLHFTKPTQVTLRLIELKLVERKKPPREVDGVKQGISANGYVHRLTKLGWLTLLTRAEHEMRHLLPPEPEPDPE